MIVWRDRFLAFSVHFIVTLLLAGAAAALIFLVWYPEPFGSMLGGLKLFTLVVGCDLALGPLISLVIFDRTKSRRTLLLDYAVVGTVQLAALVYGVMTVANARPVYVAFVKDRLEVISAADIDDADLKAGAAPFRSRPKWGPELIGTKEPEDPHARSELLLSALNGKDMSALPRYYVPYESSIDDIRKRAQPVAELEKRHPAAQPLVTSAASDLGIPKDRLLWLPVKHARGFWTVLLDAGTERPARYLPIDPY